MKFQEILSKEYVRNPAILPNAIWKTLDRFDEADIWFRIDNSLAEFDIGLPNIHIYWQKEGSNHTPYFNYGSQLLVPDYLSNYVNNSKYVARTPYFRIFQRLTNYKYLGMPESDYEIENVKLDENMEQIIELLKISYPGWNFDTKKVRSWTMTAVYDPEAWICIREKQKVIALGIADFDYKHKELSLEWIQVHPKHRRKGLGCLVVSELLSRYENKASFASVSGQTNNTTKPELLYRNMGFSGDSAWLHFY